MGGGRGVDVTLSTSSDEGVVGDSVGSAALLVHFIEQFHGQLPVAGLFTGTDETAVGDHAALTPLPHHLLEHLCANCVVTRLAFARDMPDAALQARETTVLARCR